MTFVSQVLEQLLLQYESLQNAADPQSAPRAIVELCDSRVTVQERLLLFGSIAVCRQLEINSTLINGVSCKNCCNVASRNPIVFHN